ncbi:His/Gly/Thr/Pro-type tRNA ligase C-terminal domain-containing protein, partial [Pseudomonadota bacterium]
GMERLIALLEESGVEEGLGRPHAYMVLVGEEPQRQGMQLAERLRDAVPDLRLLLHCGGGSFKSQFKKADRSQARYAVVLGDEELARGVAGIKPLRGEGEQQEIALDELAGFLQKNLARDISERDANEDDVI